jgi:hypothetical protein
MVVMDAKRAVTGAWRRRRREQRWTGVRGTVLQQERSPGNTAPEEQVDQTLGESEAGEASAVCCDGYIVHQGLPNYALTLRH